MKLVAIWLFGVPLAVAAMLATAAMWPAEPSVVREAQREALEAVSASAHSSDGYLEHVLHSVSQ
jgi:hypothetical protein